MCDAAMLQWQNSKLENIISLYLFFNDIDIFTRVCTYVQHGSMFCFVVLVLLLGETLVRILHY
jgi:hypothetical protein